MYTQLHFSVYPKTLTLDLHFQPSTTGLILAFSLGIIIITFSDTETSGSLNLFHESPHMHKSVFSALCGCLPHSTGALTPQVRLHLSGGHLPLGLQHIPAWLPLCVSSLHPSRTLMSHTGPSSCMVTLLTSLGPSLPAQSHPELSFHQLDTKGNWITDENSRICPNESRLEQRSSKCVL